jgi:hypothetical protein
MPPRVPTAGKGAGNGATSGRDKGATVVVVVLVVVEVVDVEVVVDVVDVDVVEVDDDAVEAGTVEPSAALPPQAANTAHTEIVTGLHITAARYRPRATTWGHPRTSCSVAKSSTRFGAHPDLRLCGRNSVLFG